MAPDENLLWPAEGDRQGLDSPLPAADRLLPDSRPEGERHSRQDDRLRGRARKQPAPRRSPSPPRDDAELGEWTIRAVVEKHMPKNDKTGLRTHVVEWTARYLKTLYHNIEQHRGPGKDNPSSWPYENEDVDEVGLVWSRDEEAKMVTYMAKHLETHPAWTASWKTGMPTLARAAYKRFGCSAYALLGGSVVPQGGGIFWANDIIEKLTTLALHPVWQNYRQMQGFLALAVAVRTLDSKLSLSHIPSDRDDFVRSLRTALGSASGRDRDDPDEFLRTVLHQARGERRTASFYAHPLAQLSYRLQLVTRSRHPAPGEARRPCQPFVLGLEDLTNLISALDAMCWSAGVPMFPPANISHALVQAAGTVSAPTGEKEFFVWLRESLAHVYRASANAELSITGNCKATAAAIKAARYPHYFKRLAGFDDVDEDEDEADGEEEEEHEGAGKGEDEEQEEKEEWYGEPLDISRGRGGRKGEPGVKRTLEDFLAEL